MSRLAAHDAEGYKAHPWAKLLASIYRAVTRLVPANPDAPDFRLGKSPGPENTNWRRARKGRPDRSRLFFRSVSMPVKMIVCVWFQRRTPAAWLSMTSRSRLATHGQEQTANSRSALTSRTSAVVESGH